MNIHDLVGFVLQPYINNKWLAATTVLKGGWGIGTPVLKNIVPIHHWDEKMVSSAKAEGVPVLKIESNNSILGVIFLTLKDKEHLDFIKAKVRYLAKRTSEAITVSEV